MHFVFIPNFCLKHKVYAVDSMFSSEKYHQYMAVPLYPPKVPHELAWDQIK